MAWAVLVVVDALRAAGASLICLNSDAIRGRGLCSNRGCLAGRAEVLKKAADKGAATSARGAEIVRRQVDRVQKSVAMLCDWQSLEVRWSVVCREVACSGMRRALRGWSIKVLPRHAGDSSM